MTLTEHGERLLPLARELLSRADEVGRELQNAVPGTNLRIATPDSFLRAHLVEPLRRWKEDHPQSRIIVRTGFSPDNMAALQARSVDLAVIMARTRPTGVHVVREIPDQLVFISPPGTGLRNLERLRELQPYILGDACFFGHALSDLCDDCGLVGEHRQTLSSIESILQCVHLGLGMTVLPGSLVAKHDLRDGVLVEEVPKKPRFSYFEVCLPELSTSSKIQTISRYF